MRPDNIGNYLEILQREKELCIIDRPIDPYPELAEIQRRVLALSMAINLPT
jgi:3-polyprenyl-4-hydroxybenzoate decarboxylase